MTPKFELGRDFCTVHLPPSFIILRLLIQKLLCWQTNKQMLLKTSNALFYVTTLGNQVNNLRFADYIGMITETNQNLQHNTDSSWNHQENGNKDQHRKDKNNGHRQSQYTDVHKSREQQIRTSRRIYIFDAVLTTDGSCERNKIADIKLGRHLQYLQDWTRWAAVYRLKESVAPWRVTYIPHQNSLTKGTSLECVRVYWHWLCVGSEVCANLCTCIAFRPRTKWYHFIIWPNDREHFVLPRTFSWSSDGLTSNI